MLQVYMKGAPAALAELPAVEQQSVFQEYVDFSASPEIIEGNRLQPPATATTVRVAGGEIVTSAGPLAEAMEPLSGYYLLEAEDLDAAIELASRIPAARMGGAIEVRPIVEG
jgi:hypothetical protein